MLGQIVTMPGIVSLPRETAEDTARTPRIRVQRVVENLWAAGGTNYYTLTSRAR